mmetsp:Transcript_19615/g.62167  ORF Transcript_19615/g.62167 Transcript_19615/m.62167 type:complete len:286 (-) Transcript_19615:376-1233(-)
MEGEDAGGEGFSGNGEAGGEKGVGDTPGKGGTVGGLPAGNDGGSEGGDDGRSLESPPPLPPPPVLSPDGGGDSDGMDGPAGPGTPPPPGSTEGFLSFSVSGLKRMRKRSMAIMTTMTREHANPQSHPPHHNVMRVFIERRLRRCLGWSSERLLTLLSATLGAARGMLGGVCPCDSLASRARPAGRVPVPVLGSSREAPSAHSRPFSASRGVEPLTWPSRDAPRPLRDGASSTREDMRNAAPTCLDKRMAKLCSGESENSDAASRPCRSPASTASSNSYLSRLRSR